MKSIQIFISALIILFSLPAIAQVIIPPEKATELSPADNPYAPTTEENALLWKIDSKTLSSPSYLYGTIHMIGKEDFFLTKETKKAVAGSQRLTFEIDMEEMNDFSVLFTLISKVMMDNGISLKDLLSEEDYQLVDSHFTKIGLPLLLFERVKPMFLSVLASEDIASGSMASGDIMSYEMEFMEMAKAAEKEISGLETIEFQMSMFDSIPYQAQAQMLVESLKDENIGDSQFDQMVELYKNQDLHGMQQFFDKDTEGIAKYEKLLLENRNRNWIPIMAKMMKEKPTFFAVGAGHLGGNTGVIALLREAGYTLLPVQPKEQVSDEK